VHLFPQLCYSMATVAEAVKQPASYHTAWIYVPTLL